MERKTASTAGKSLNEEAIRYTAYSRFPILGFLGRYKESMGESELAGTVKIVYYTIHGRVEEDNLHGTASSMLGLYKNRLLESIAFDLYRDGTGCLGVVKEVENQDNYGTKRIVLESKQDAKNFNVHDKIWFEGKAPYSANIHMINKPTGSVYITISSDCPEIRPGDKIYTEVENTGRALIGMERLLANRHYTTKDEHKQLGLLDKLTLALASEPDMQTDLVFVDMDMFGDLCGLLEHRARYETFTVGHNEGQLQCLRLDVAGKTFKVIGDDLCPPNSAFALKGDTWNVKHRITDKTIGLLTQEVMETKVSPTFSSIHVLLSFYGRLQCTDLNHNLWITV